MFTRLKNAILFWLRCLVSNTEEEKKLNSGGTNLPHC